ENGVTRPKKYSELSTTEAIQADYDVKAMNIILQRLPPEVYALRERECKLYDEFDKFAYKKGESLRDFYLRFSLLLNDMNIYNMKLEQFQVNTKFLNTLPLEWSKFVTDVKLVRDLHTTNVDQLHAYLGQHEYHANEYASKAQSSKPLSITYPSNDFQSSVNHNVYNPLSLIPQMKYALAVHQQFEFSQHDTGLFVPMFQKGDDLIDAINHMMLFLTTVVTSRYPPTNNQLRTSSNPHQQATINNGRVTIQPIQGRQNFMTAGMSRQYTSGPSGTSRKQRVIICYNCKGEGHMLNQCTKPKRKRDEAWFKDKVLLIALMANLSHYGSDNLAEVHNQDNVTNNVIHHDVQATSTSEQLNILNQSETEITSERIPRKGQNQIKTGQKREAWRSREKSEAVTVERAGKTKENIKRRARNANHTKYIKERKKKGDDQSCSDEDVLKKIVSKPLCEEEIIPMKSLRIHDSSLLISSKIDSLLDEHSSYREIVVRPPEEFVSANSDAKIKYFSPSPILVKDSDSLMEEIDLFCTPDYPMPPGIEDEDYDSERDILIRKDLPRNNTLSFAKKESFHFDIPSFSRPPAKPPDGDTGILNIKMMGDISDQKAFMHKLMITLALDKEKSPDLLSHRGLKAFPPFVTCPMMIHGQNNPPLDVLLFHFYPL
nr:hypothetical protein [Tanacetum cinerariifolium]